MSLVPDNRVCLDCGGYELTGLGNRASLSSRCMCDDHFIITPAGRAFLDDPPRGACAAWVRDPHRWRPTQGAAA